MNNKATGPRDIGEMLARENMLERAVLEAVNLAEIGWSFATGHERTHANIINRLADLKAIVCPHIGGRKFRETICL